MSTNRFRDACPLDCKVYVGELGTSGNRHEIEEAFGYFGPLRSVWVAKKPPGFAFVMFEDPRDARDAVRQLDGELICGRRIKAELSTGKSRREGGPVSMPPRGSFPPKGPPRGGFRDRSPIGRGPPRGRAEYHGHSNYHENQHFDSREHYNNSRYPRKHRSWSRSRSFSPPMHGRSSGRSGPSENYNGGPHMRSRSRSPQTKSPRSDSRYR